MRYSIDDNECKVAGAYIEAAEARKAELDALLAGGDLAEQARRFGKVRFAKTWWNVIEEKEGKALIVADRPIDGDKVLPYDNSGGAQPTDRRRRPIPATWEGCSLRKWLNREFLARATQEELAYVVETHLDNSTARLLASPWFRQHVHRRNYRRIASALSEVVECPDTVDKVFLLSVEELYGLDAGLASYTWTRNGGVRDSGGHPGAFEYSVRGYHGGEILDKEFSVLASAGGRGVIPAAWISLAKDD